MKSEDVKVVSKKVEVEGSPYAYVYPESLEEAIVVDGKEKVFSFYLQQRKIRFMDGKRKESTGGGIPKSILNLIKSKNLSEDQILELAALLSLDVDGIIGAQNEAV